MPRESAHTAAGAAAAAAATRKGLLVLPDPALPSLEILDGKIGGEREKKPRSRQAGPIFSRFR